MRRLIIAVTTVALAISAASPVVARNEKPDGPGRKLGQPKHNFETVLSEKRDALRQRGLELLLTGEANPAGKNKVVKIAPGQFAELAFEGEDQILTLLAEFGDGDPTHNHGSFGVITHTGDAFAHNSIPQPDRSVDNTTIWTENFSREHYEQLLYSRGTFPSMANWYLEQSSGRYTVDGYVGDWVEVPNNPAAYGSDYCGSIVCGPDTWRFVQDQANGWYQSLVDDGMTEAEIEDLLDEFDVWDRYDYDGDGNFDEPDGYIDHFQSVHAGEGQETGGGALGSDAIWSHRWYVQLTRIGAGGPTVGGDVVPFGGTRIGNSSKWIGDYTIEPENGGVGVFAHEYAHDLGLPDLYDTSGNTGGAENGTGFWTIMSSGSYGSQNGIDIGSAPVHFGNWEKFQLGWLNYTVGFAGQTSAHKLGLAETNTRQAQGLFVVLPDKEVPLDLGDPYEGSLYYYSDAGDNLDNSMTKTVTLPASGDLELNAQVRYDIEVDWDYAYLTVNGNGVPTNRSTTTDPHGQNFGFGITGSSGGNWVPLTANLSGFAGQTVEIGFRYWTDGAVVEPGFQVDALEIPGQPLDGAESDAGWTFDGFRTTSGSESQFFFNAYVAEFRTYWGYDKALQTGPYNFGFLDDPDLQNYVEHFAYEDGLLISYWDTSFSDNNVGDHPGGGLILPVDAHPNVEHWANGDVMRPRLQTYDATFGLSPTTSITLHNNSVPSTIASKPAEPLFDDTESYWVNGDPGDAPGTGRYQSEWNSVDVPNTGTTIRVVSITSNGSMMTVHVNR